MQLRRPKTDADPIREAEEAIARARADRDRIEAEAEEIRERLGRVGNARASALLGDGDAEQIAHEARERRGRLAEIETETEDLTAAIGTLSLRVVSLRAQAAATEKTRADLETADRQLDLNAAADAYQAARQRHQAAEEASEQAGRIDLRASMFASRNAIAPLRVIYRRAVEDKEVATNPTSGLRLPSVRDRHDRIASPEEAERLLASLSDGDAAIYATAVYAGLRRGELQALRWEDVALEESVLRVERSYDPKEGSYVETKTRAGTRSVPLPPILREILHRHLLRSGRRAGLVFGRSAASPFDGRALDRRAQTAWKKADPPLRPIGLHECRHTFASLAIAAGVNAKALSTYLGHASIVITLDRYGHLMPGNEEEAAGLLDAYLARATEAGR